jgi:hypothetical protein
MKGAMAEGPPQRSFQAVSRNPIVKPPVIPRDPSASLRMTVLMGADGK